MAASTTISVRLPKDVEDRLARLAASTKRTKSFLAGEAIATYVQRELDIIAGINQGLEDARAGRLVPHDQAMAELDAAIVDAGKAARRARRR